MSRNVLAIPTRADGFRRVTEESMLAVQIFDQKKFKKKDQGFLGVVNVRIGSVVDMEAGGDGMFPLDCCPTSADRARNVDAGSPKSKRQSNGREWQADPQPVH